MAVFLFLVQAFTGALLAFNYAPTPGDAYNSLRYILTELTAGRLIRGLQSIEGRELFLRQIATTEFGHQVPVACAFPLSAALWRRHVPHRDRTRPAQ